MAVSYKADKMVVLGQERYFVIPRDAEIFEIVDPNSPKIKGPILCQAIDMEAATRIAAALNYYDLKKPS
jgi:hypothetical protein